MWRFVIGDRIVNEYWSLITTRLYVCERAEIKI